MSIVDIIVELDNDYKVISLEYEGESSEFFKPSFNLYMGMNIRDILVMDVDSLSGIVD